MAWKFYDSNGNVLQLTGSHTLDSHTGTVDSAEIASGAIDLAHMSVNSIDSNQYVDGSIDLVHMSDNSVDSDQYVDASIDLVHMSVNSIDSDQYVDGSIDLAHMSANSVDSSQYVDRSIDTVHIGLNQVTLAEMAGGTDGQVITYDASGDPVAVGPGTSGQVLTSAGTGAPPTFAAASGGISAAQMMAYERLPDFIGDTKSNPGVAKAWIHYDHSQDSVLAEYNIDSVTDTSTGLFTVVFDIDFSTGNYAIAGINRENGATNEATGLSIQYNYAPAAGSAPLLNWRLTGTSRIDSPDVGVTFHGDQ